jgi:hypothetical protein
MKKLINPFVMSKTIDTCTMITPFPIVFYFCTSTTGEIIFALDIATLIIAFAVGLIVASLFSRSVKKVALVTLIVLGNAS